MLPAGRNLSLLATTKIVTQGSLDLPITVQYIPRFASDPFCSVLKQRVFRMNGYGRLFCQRGASVLQTGFQSFMVVEQGGP